MLEVGSRIGEYVIEHELGLGGMARVFKARHFVLETHHAIKVLLPVYRENSEVRKRFLDEAKVQAKHLDHANIVKVTGIIATDEHAALVMELVEGKTLEEELAGLMTHPADIVRIMIDVLGAVGHAHKLGVIHRDLKPANILLANRDGKLIPKVADFGIAKIASTIEGYKKSTHADTKMGTLQYMAPEQVLSAKDVTPRSDIFALGAILYEMATGHVAFDGDGEFQVMEAIVHGRYEKPAARNPRIEPRVARVIEKALSVEASNRFASCEEMAAALREPDHVAVAPAAQVEPVAEVVARRSSLGIGIGLVALALAVLVVGLVVVLKKTDPPQGSPSVAGVVASADAASAPAEPAVELVPAAAPVVEDVGAAPVAAPTPPPKPKPCPPAPAPPPPKPTADDSDGDGVPNATDKCATELERMNQFADEDGCDDHVPKSYEAKQDRDGDGLIDNKDCCPDHPGANRGCPK